MTPRSVRTPRSSEFGGLSARDVLGDRCAGGSAADAFSVGGDGRGYNEVGGVRGAQTGVTNSLEWAVLDKLAAQMHKQDTAKQRTRDAELQGRLREDLQKQIIDVQVKHDREKEQERQFHEMQVESFNQWQKSEIEKTVGKREKGLAQKQEQDLQIKELQEKKRAEKEEADREAKELVAKLAGETDLERKRVEERWAAQRDMARKALDVSSVCTKEKKDKEKEQLHLENERTENHQRLQTEREQQARERKEAERRQILARESVGAENFAQEKKKQDEAALKATTERRDKELRAIRIEEENQSRLAKQKFETQAYLLQQMDAKKSAKQDELQRRNDHRQKQEQDAEAFQQNEWLRDQDKRGRNIEHRAQLERQITLKMGKGCAPGQKPAGAVMSEVELRLNKNLLERVNMALSEISERRDPEEY